MDKFYWGAATSAHQVEGNNHNDWSEWELRNAERLAENAQKNPLASARLPDGQGWPDYILNPPAGGPNPLQKENYISGRACDHYNRFEEDFDIAQSLGHTAHRFSIEWSRIEPEEGKFDEKEIEHYRNVIRALRTRGMEPFVTLWHWTLPIWVMQNGGWESSRTINDFVKYTAKIVSALNEDVRFWITINEPEIYARNSYLLDIWPPQYKNLLTYINVVKKLFDAHDLASEIINGVNKNAKVGIAHNHVHFLAYKNKLSNRILVKFLHWWINVYPQERCRNSTDVIYLNYYFRATINNFWQKNENKETSDMGWELYPEGIYHLLRNLKKYQKPIYITENGLADARDIHREWFIRKTIEAVMRAKKEGVNVRGYFHWSLLDNFEWDKGFWPRFGLVAVNYNTMERKIRPSAYAYKKMIEQFPNI